MYKIFTGEDSHHLHSCDLLYPWFQLAAVQHHLHMMIEEGGGQYLHEEEGLSHLEKDLCLPGVEDQCHPGAGPPLPTRCDVLPLLEEGHHHLGGIHQEITGLHPQGAGLHHLPHTEMQEAQGMTEYHCRTGTLVILFDMLQNLG